MLIMNMKGWTSTTKVMNSLHHHKSQVQCNIDKHHLETMSSPSAQRICPVFPSEVTILIMNLLLEWKRKGEMNTSRIKLAVRSKMKQNYNYQVQPLLRVNTFTVT